MQNASPYINPFDDPSIAQGYEAWYQTQGRRADHLKKQLFKSLLKELPKSHTLLEIGCGTGHFTRWFETQGLCATGLDISSVMLEETKTGIGPVYVLADAEHLPFALHSFDLIAFITTLEFLQNTLQALQEATRVARQGIILGAINRKSWIGREYLRQGGPIWKAAHLFSLKELRTMVKKFQRKVSSIFWKTTLWRLCPWALPLPWGGFIGVGIQLSN
jgi:ubiquinone/menaquinone biosynthesis C-methylase UbiE